MQAAHQIKDGGMKMLGDMGLCICFPGGLRCHIMVEGDTHACQKPTPTPTPALSGDDVALGSTVKVAGGAVVAAQASTGEPGFAAPRTAASSPDCPGRVNLGARKRDQRALRDESDHPAVARWTHAKRVR
jgi:hypothetical protein